MNSNDLTAIVQKGFRVTLGAVTSLVDTLQDAQKWEQSLTDLQFKLSELSHKWEQRGTTTEQEARKLVNQFWEQQTSGQRNTDPSSDSASSQASGPSNVHADLQDLTAQLASMRMEVERLRNQTTD